MEVLDCHHLTEDHAALDKFYFGISRTRQIKDRAHLAKSLG
jgi:hypothetical protein